MYSAFVSAVKRNEYIDVEHLFPLLFGAFVVLVAFFDNSTLNQVMRLPDSSTLLREPLVTGLKGVVAGMVTHYTYTITETSFKSQGSFQTKEKALFIIVVLGVGTGFTVDVAIPWMVNLFLYDVVQTAGLLLVIGMWYIHLLVSNWKVSNEWPHLLGGGLIAFGPYLPYLL